MLFVLFTASSNVIIALKFIYILLLCKHNKNIFGLYSTLISDKASSFSALGIQVLLSCKDCCFHLLNQCLYSTVFNFLLFLDFIAVSQVHHKYLVSLHNSQFYFLILFSMLIYWIFCVCFQRNILPPKNFFFFL